MLGVLGGVTRAIMNYCSYGGKNLVSGKLTYIRL